MASPAFPVCFVRSAKPAEKTLNGRQCGQLGDFSEFASFTAIYGRIGLVDLAGIFHTSQNLGKFGRPSKPSKRSTIGHLEPGRTFLFLNFRVTVLLFWLDDEKTLPVWHELSFIVEKASRSTGSSCTRFPRLDTVRSECMLMDEF